MNGPATMLGKTCLLTGGTAGVGRAGALALARQGARVVIVGRDALRNRKAVEDLRRASGNDGIESITADLSSVHQVRAAAAEFMARFDRLDVLVNCAGALFVRRTMTEDGSEMTFALNHLAPFHLSLLLLGPLESAAPSRIVNVSSQAHRRWPLDPAQLRDPPDYNGWRAYCRSKLANLMFTLDLAQRLEGTGITVNALHPGFVATAFGMNNGLGFRLLTRPLKLFARSPAAAGEALAHLAAAPGLERVTGRYFIDGQAVPPAPASSDAAQQRLLWRLSLEAVGLAETEPVTAAERWHAGGPPPARRPP